MTPRAVCPGQMVCTVRTVRSMMPSVDEMMPSVDRRMDNFATPDTSISALSVLPDILLTSSKDRRPGSNSERTRCAVLRCGHGGNGRRSVATFGGRLGAIGRTHSTGCRELFCVHCGQRRRPACVLLLLRPYQARVGHPWGPGRRHLGTPPGPELPVRMRNRL